MLRNSECPMKLKVFVYLLNLTTMMDILSPWQLPESCGSPGSFRELPRTKRYQQPNTNTNTINFISTCFKFRGNHRWVLSIQSRSLFSGQTRHRGGQSPKGPAQQSISKYQQFCHYSMQGHKLTCCVILSCMAPHVKMCEWVVPNGIMPTCWHL